MPKVYTTIIYSCGECPHIVPGESDDYTCRFNPPRCSKVLTKKLGFRIIRLKLFKPKIPTWCPLPG